MSAQPGAHELGPAVAGEVACEKLPMSSHLFGFSVHVVHELVDQGDGDLLDLGFWVWNFAHKDVAGGVDAALGVGV